MLAPSALVLFAFGIFPLLFAFGVSLWEWRHGPDAFLGFGNYARALAADSEFWPALRVTVYYVLGTVPPTIIIGYLFAEMLHQRLAGLAVYRALFFTPYIVSPVAAAIVWRWIYDPQFGLANWLFTSAGLQQQRWLMDPRGVFQIALASAGVSVPESLAGPSVALCSIMLVAIWHSVGFAVVVLLAGLANVPSEITEAARMDGARGWTLFRHVKLPLLSPTFFFLLIVFTIRSFQTFTQIFVLSPDQRGGPLGTTQNVTLYIYSAFYLSRGTLGPGYGSAVAFLLFSIILLLTLLQFRVLGRRVHYQ